MIHTPVIDRQDGFTERREALIGQKFAMSGFSQASDIVTENLSLEIVSYSTFHFYFSLSQFLDESFVLCKLM